MQVHDFPHDYAGRVAQAMATVSVATHLVFRGRFGLIFKGKNRLVLIIVDSTQIDFTLFVAVITFTLVSAVYFTSATQRRHE
ncbi:hypothetical protein FA10DRAFT_264601 [Acaromyces ingoldii]|uniref:Uncharacterized protein n=1 Tax=Acaromyces ingoldii TaxID=215250 RepID=A0A316Z1E0_9BASI|nr:hypothetical protein FA10DRAFT_264601 [Acaromyces ingoldii]PWN94005.1 hypothetical protein FA10DRAFT_264601 [Acaromyces ingoldii]